MCVYNSTSIYVKQPTMRNSCTDKISTMPCFLQFSQKRLGLSSFGWLTPWNKIIEKCTDRISTVDHSTYILGETTLWMDSFGFKFNKLSLKTNKFGHFLKHFRLFKPKKWVNLELREYSFKDVTNAYSEKNPKFSRNCFFQKYFNWLNLWMATTGEFPLYPSWMNSVRQFKFAVY